MSKFVIIEGPDSTGKTTLAKFLCKEMRAAYIWASGDRLLHGSMEAYHIALIRSAEVTLKCGVSVIMDRLWPSEWVYGRKLRPDTIYYPFTYMWTRLADLKPTYVFCHSDLGCDRQLASPDKSHPYDRAEYCKIVDGYVELQKSWDMVPGHKISYCPEIDGMTMANWAHKHDLIP